MADNSRSDALKRLADEIQRKQDLTRSLSLAGRRQRYMLPKDVDIPGYEVASIYLPCSDVSGDFYDILALDEENTALVLGDVAGHGIEAALVMGMGKKAMGIFAKLYRTPAEVLSRANDELSKDLDAETFITGIYGLLEVPTGKLTLARAGHPRPVLFNPERSPNWSYVDARGLVMGMTTGDTYRKSLSEAEVLMAPGDLFFVYTDGLVEAFDARKEAFGADRMLEVIEKYGAEGPHAVIAAMLKRVEEFLGGREQQDDITLIALKRLK